MRSQGSGRFLGAAFPPGAPRRPASEPVGLPFHAGSPAFDLFSAGPIFKTENLLIRIVGAICEVDDARYQLARFRSEPERLVAELYARHGRRLVQYLDGWFLIILYDIGRAELLILNNPYTSSGCCYHHDAEGLVFADDARGILDQLERRPELDRDSIVNYLNCGYNHTQRTCFRSIHKLSPGCTLAFRDNVVRLERNYRIEFQRRTKIDLPAALDEYENLFRDDLAHFFEANEVREAGCALSGGLDTSWTFHAAARAHPRPVHGYTAWFGKPQYDELEHAAYVVEVNGGVGHQVKCGARDFDLFPELIRIAEEPVLSVALPMYRLMQEARHAVDALIVGEGGNNIYSIYYPVAEAHKYFSRLPWALRKRLPGVLSGLGRATGRELFRQAEHVAKIYASAPDYFRDYFERLSAHFHFDREMRDDLLDHSAFGHARMHRSPDEIAMADETFFDDLINQNITQGLKPYLLFFEHRIARRFGLALSAPFVSKKVVAFVNSLPENLVVGGRSWDKLLKNKNCERRFHKSALERRYKAEHVHREPRLFYAPYHSMFAERPALGEKLLTALKKRGWFNHRYLDGLFAEHKSQREHPSLNSQFASHGQRLTALLGCEVWARLFLDGKGAGTDLDDLKIEDFLD